MTACRNPLLCLVPPTLLENILERGNRQQRSLALRMLRLDNLIRSVRLTNAITPVERDALGGLGAALVPTPTRTIVDADNRPTVRGKVVRSEGDGPTGDSAVDQAYDGLGDTFEFYLQAYQRNSIDNEGLPLRGVVHYSRDYGNAFWDGHQMVFGDGDGEIFSSLTGSVDVIGHELTHGVTEDECGLAYLGQSGALNESISDVFGSLVKQHKKHQRADQANWLIGEDVFTPEIDGDALRSLKAPGTAYDDPLVGKDDQPAHMDDYVFTIRDNGGVHINSGIPNHAFYLAAVDLGGYAWERAGLIWYEAVRDPATTSRSTFTPFARTTVAAAQRLYGHGSDEEDAVRDAWNGVGVQVG
jgi:Zn-dependent metalloprotease